jgi:hypothetical protein
MVMLEKKLGVALTPKLRAILLKEADGNMLDGHVFGGRALAHARAIGFIPEEKLAEKQKMAEDGVHLILPRYSFSIPIHLFTIIYMYSRYLF